MRESSITTRRDKADVAKIGSEIEHYTFMSVSLMSLHNPTLRRYTPSMIF